MYAYIHKYLCIINNTHSSASHIYIVSVPRGKNNRAHAQVEFIFLRFLDGFRLLYLRYPDMKLCARLQSTHSKKDMQGNAPTRLTKIQERLGNKKKGRTRLSHEHNAPHKKVALFLYTERMRK